MASKRKYSDAFLDIGFIEKDSKPQCVICLKVLSNECMKRSKLLRHFNSEHASHRGKPTEYFQRRKQDLEEQRRILTSRPLNEVTVVSYKIAHRVAKAGKSFDIVEKIVYPCIEDTVKTLFGEKELKKVREIPRSARTIVRRLQDMSDDVRLQLLDKIRRSPFFAVQFDESTDCANVAQLLCFVRFLDKDEMRDDMLFCAPLVGRATSKEIFGAFERATSNMNLNWNKCVGICTDGAPNMTGCNKGFVELFLTVAPNAKWTHCIIHRQALASKAMPAELKNIMDACVKVVNFIKSNKTNSRLFKLLCDETDAEHHQLLMHTEVRWLSRGNMLGRLFSLRNEARLFLHEMKRDDLSEVLHKEGSIARVAFLTDIFAHINVLNKTLQTPSMNQIVAKQKLEAFKKKLSLWHINIQDSNFDAFPKTAELFQLGGKPDTALVDLMKEHVRQLSANFDDYIPREDLNRDSWVLNPFCFDAQNMPETLCLSEKESLLELSCDKVLESILDKRGTVAFWSKAITSHRALATKALEKLVPFATSYKCESAFSEMVSIKTKERNRLDSLNLEGQLRIKISNIEPRFESLARAVQEQNSH